MLFVGMLCFPPFCENAFLVKTFELKYIGWRFWCLGLWSEGQGITWHHSFYGWSVRESTCPFICLSVCSVFISLQSCLSVCPSYGQFVCPSIHLSIYPPVLLPAYLSVGLSSNFFIYPFISLYDHQADLHFIYPTVCLCGLHRGLFLTVTGDWWL